MKKLLLVALTLVLFALGTVTDSLARFGRHSGARAHSRHYGAAEYGHYDHGNCSSCHGRGCGRCYEEEECAPPPCCEREATITVREKPRKVCGWTCPDGTHEKPAAEAAGY